MNLVYCIDCGKTEEANDHGDQHVVVQYDDPEIGLSSLDFCNFPLGYAFTAPPEFDMDAWLERVWEIEPSDEELREIEAEQIERDYEWLIN